MGVRIAGIEPGSIASRLGIKPGDILRKISGHEIADVLDYRFYMTEKTLTLSLSGEGGDCRLKIKKGEYEDLGLAFDTYLMDEEKSCRNNCVFCFIDQLPDGLRETLYFKDDDSRLGFLFGNYITLTNLDDADISRIIALKTSPVNISVHTMNPALRVKMMKNPRAGTSLTYLAKLANSGIKLNCQLVLCPGINDGRELEYSLNELAGLGENLQSVSIVPVGLTKHREGLCSLRLFTREESAAVIRTAEKFAQEQMAKRGSRVFFPSDEFYLSAEIPLPGNDYYEDYFQLENGVGMMPLLRHEFLTALEAEPSRNINRHVTIVTGTTAAPLLSELMGLAAGKLTGLCADIAEIKNDFFGENITVAGLITGRDIIAQLKNKPPHGDLLIPATMLRHEGDLFLDGMATEDIEKALDRRVRVVGCDGYSLLDAVLGY